MVTESYNEISQGCDDVYKRWMVDTNWHGETVVTDSDDPYVKADLDMEISCDNCPEQEEFASIYPEIARRVLMRSHNLFGEKDWPTQSPSPLIRKLASKIASTPSEPGMTGSW